MRAWRATAAAPLLTDAIAACAIAVAIIVVVTGELRFELFGILVQAHSVWRPIVVAVIAIAASMVFIAGRGAREERGPAVVEAVFRVTWLAILVADLGLVLERLVMSGGGLDSAGYLGAATLLLTGHLTEHQPVAHVLPFANATAAAAPLGFVPARELFHIAPEFPIGLPLVMAVFKTLMGPSGPFYVAPVLGAATVAMVAALARRVTDLTGARLAAVFVATSPIFLNMAIQPMSDVPATFWVVLAAFVLWRASPAPALGAGAAGMAVLTRPPLLLVALAFAVTTDWRSRRDAVVYLVITSLFVSGLMLLQWHMYGNPLVSGHGSASQLFTLAAFRQNVVNHLKWLLTIHTPLIVLAFGAGVRAVRRFAGRAAAVFAATAAPYLFYAGRYEDWEILRFLLPGLVFVLITCACGLVWLTNFGRRRQLAQIAATTVAAGVAVGSLSFASRHHVFDLWRQESRYRLVAEWFTTHAPSNAVAIAELHSGSIRYFSRRATLRMEALPAGKLLDTVEALQQARYEPYLVLDAPSEFDVYLRRFRPDAIVSLQAYPEARIRGTYVIRLGSNRR